MTFRILFILFLISMTHATLHANVTATQLDRTASELLTASGHNLSGEIFVDASRAGGFAAISWQGNYGRIFVDPGMMRNKSLNTWAFVIGHELGHHILRHRGRNGPPQEFAADEVGARMAKKAGYDVKRYIRSLYNESNSCSRSHGCWHDRARNLERKFGSTGGWDSKHKDHETGIGAFPPLKWRTIIDECTHALHQRGDIAPCEHALHPNGDVIPCEHPCYDYWGNVFPCHAYGDIAPCLHPAHLSGDLYSCSHVAHPSGHERRIRE